jgi:hypothetical protein
MKQFIEKIRFVSQSILFVECFQEIEIPNQINNLDDNTGLERKSRNFDNIVSSSTKTYHKKPNKKLFSKVSFLKQC